MPPTVTRSPSPRPSVSAISMSASAASRSFTPAAGGRSRTGRAPPSPARRSVRLSNSSDVITPSSISLAACVATAEAARTARRPRPCARPRSGPRSCPGSRASPPPPVPERVERPGVDQALEHLLGQAPRDPPCGSSRRTPVNAPFARRASMICCTAPEPTLRTADRPVPDLRLAARRRREVLFGLVHVGRQHLEPHQPARVQVERLAVLVVADARQDRRHVLDRVVRLQVRGLVRDVAVRARVRGVEPVVGERLHQVEQVVGPAAPGTRCRRSPAMNFSRCDRSARRGSSCPSPGGACRPRPSSSRPCARRSASPAPGRP